MALLDRKTPGLVVDKSFLAKIEHARTNNERFAAKRDEAWEFYRGNHYAFIDSNNRLSSLSTSLSPRGGKPQHRVRQARNFIFDIVLREVSAATQQVPSYQVVASTMDPQDRSAAAIAEQVALYGYHEWNLRKMTIDAVAHAVVGGEAFAWAYFDNSLGPFLDEEGTGTGDVRVRVFGGNQTYWVPGLPFDESPYHCVELAMEPQAVMDLQGYLGGTVSPDANVRSSRSTDKGKLTLVTHYLERPCARYPEGRWLTLANKRQILAERPYPGQGNAPVLRPLVYAPDPESDRAIGLVPQLIDAMRTINDAENKQVEWKNMALFPQWVVSPGLLKRQRRTDEPMKVYEIPDPERNVKIVEPPPVPDSLARISDRATDHMLRIAGQQDIPPGVDSARGIQTIIERNLARGAMFVASLAQFHADVMHDCLAQVAEFYTEPRLLAVKGDFGWAPIQDFQGKQLRGQMDVRVFAESIEPQTKQGKEQKIMNYVSMGAISPDEAMTAIETGSTEGLIRSYALDQSRVERIIQRIKEGTIMEMPMIPNGRMRPEQDPMTGQVQMVPEEAPGYMPRYADNLGIFRSVFENFLKSEEYERIAADPIDVGTGEIHTIGSITADIYAGVLRLEAEKAMEEQAAQDAQAEAMGMANAAKPQGPKSQPSLPAIDGGNPSE